MSTTAKSQSSTDLREVPVGQQVRIRDANGDTWHLSHNDAGITIGLNTSGYKVSSTNPTWIKLQGVDPQRVAAIPFAVEVDQPYYLGGFELRVVEILPG